MAKSQAALRAAEARNLAPIGRRFSSVNAVSEPEPIKETLKEKIERQRSERFAQSERNWQYVQANEDRYAAQRAETLANRRAANSAYQLTEKEWNKDLQKLAKEYQWDTSQQENVSIAILTLEEANEYLDLLIKDTHGQLSVGKDYTGVGM